MGQATNFCLSNNRVDGGRRHGKGRKKTKDNNVSPHTLIEQRGRTSSSADPQTPGNYNNRRLMQHDADTFNYPVADQSTGNAMDDIYGSQD